MKIPWSDLEELAKKRDLSHCILLAHDNDGLTDHVVTYGTTLEACSQAADFGNRIKDSLGWPESLHAQPPRVIALQDEIREANDLLDTLGNIASGDTLSERVEATIKHYATQIGRWGK